MGSKIPSSKAIQALSKKYERADLLGTSGSSPHPSYSSFDNPDGSRPQSPHNEEGLKSIETAVVGFWSDFIDFIMISEVFSLGVGIIIGTVFTDMINSLVSDILTPPLGLLFGGETFENRFIVLKIGISKSTYNTIKEAIDDGAVTINYGLFTLSLLRFLLIALILFWLIKLFQMVQRHKARLAIKKKSALIKQNDNIASQSKSPTIPQGPTLQTDRNKSGSPIISNNLKFTDMLDQDQYPITPYLIDNKDLELEYKKCRFCLKLIPNLAVRCHACTSILNQVGYDQLFLESDLPSSS